MDVRALTARNLLWLGLRRLVRVDGGTSLPKRVNLAAHTRFLWDLARIRFRWSAAADRPRYRRRHYRGYAAYLEHQSRKLSRVDLSEYDCVYRTVLRERLERLPQAWQGARVLCLAARIGTEVKAFLDLGAFAVGVDINPGPRNRYVVHGDFHHLQYADHSVDLVFSNSLDHVFDLDRWMSEIARVLRADGALLLEVSAGMDEGGRPEFYESLCWTSVDEVIADFAERGFVVEGRSAFERPSSGHQLLFRRQRGTEGPVEETAGGSLAAAVPDGRCPTSDREPAYMTRRSKT